MTRPTKSQLDDVLHYDPETGVFMWTKKTCRRVVPGRVAGCMSHNGYRKIGTPWGRFYSHHLAWVMMTGEWPPEGLTVDHRDGVEGGDRWSNLRLADRDQQAMNTKLRCDNAAGVKGVCFEADRGKWKAQLTARGKKVLDARFDTKEEAVAAREAAQAIHFGGFARVVA